MQRLGERIRELREALDTSLRELARCVDISAAFLSDIELGRRFPSEALLEKLAKHLKTTYKDLSKYDSRAPLEDLRKKSAADPRYGFALRSVVEAGLSAEDLMKLVEKKKGKKKQ